MPGPPGASFVFREGSNSYRKLAFPSATGSKFTEIGFGGQGIRSNINAAGICATILTRCVRVPGQRIVRLSAAGRNSEGGNYSEQGAAAKPRGQHDD
jgi:hypothetical protein